MSEGCCQVYCEKIPMLNGARGFSVESVCGAALHPLGLIQQLAKRWSIGRENQGGVKDVLGVFFELITITLLNESTIKACATKKQIKVHVVTVAS